MCSWLAEQGLGSYLSSGKHWIMSGQTLLQASQQDLEKVATPVLFVRVSLEMYSAVQHLSGLWEAQGSLPATPTPLP